MPFERRQKKIPAPIPTITAGAPITPPTMGPTGIEFLDIEREVLDCVEPGYRPVEDKDEAGDGPEVEVLLGIVVVVEFSVIGELHPDIVVDFDDDAVPMTVENARPTCPV